MTRPPRESGIRRTEPAHGGRIDTQTRSVARTLSRPRSSASILDSTFGTTRRDLELCLDLYEHRVLTTHQIFELRFANERRAQRRLLILHQRGILDRFRPFRSKGSHPWHYILGDVGIDIVAAWRGCDRKQLDLRPERLRAIAHSPRLTHLVEVNDFFSHLAYRCRMQPAIRLEEWWGERRCAAAWSGIVRPDGLGRLTGVNAELRFFLELDRGTENSSRLEEKLARYARVSRFSDSPDAVLFVFPTERREAEARRVLFNCGMNVLTASRTLTIRNPLGPVWLPVNESGRVRLLDLGQGAA